MLVPRAQKFFFFFFTPRRRQRIRVVVRVEGDIVNRAGRGGGKRKNRLEINSSRLLREAEGETASRGKYTRK